MEWVKENRHILEAYLWVLLAIPSLLWWKESILWVIFISLYANYKTAASTHEAHKGRRAAEANNGN